MLSAFYEAMTGRGPDLLRAYALAIAIQTLGVHLLLTAGHLTVAVPPFFGLATALGGVTYGLGMVLAVGCAAAVLYRAGEGKLDYVAGALGFWSGATVGGRWIADPVRGVLHGPGASASLVEVLSIDRWLAVGIATVLLGVVMMLCRTERAGQPAGRWTWTKTGSLIGLLGVCAALASVLTGRLMRPGVVPGGSGLFGFLRGDTAAADYGVIVMLGILVGSMIAARLHGASPARPFGSARVLRSLGGGALMGISAALVVGENLAHGLHGISLLALSSLTFMAGMFLGVHLGIRLGWLR